MKFPKLSKKVLIPSITAVTLLGGGGAFALQSVENHQDIAPIPEVSENIDVKEDDKQVVQTPVEEQLVVTEEIPAPTSEPVEEPQLNPYPEGFNIWHIWNRRTELGLTMPNGPDGDAVWCSLALKDENVSKSKTPTLHAIVCKGQFAVGFVEEVKQDGSITVSCTNCQGWNTLVEKDIPAEAANREFIYIN